MAVVAGGARGIGRSSALRLAVLSARVAVLDIDPAAAAAYGEELGASSLAEELRARADDGLARRADLTSEAAAREAIDAVAERWGRIDVLVSAAGGTVTP